MFRKLKWRFVLLIMSLLVLVFAGIFGAIYGLTANSMNRQSQFALEKIMRAPPKVLPESRETFGSLIVETDQEGGLLFVLSHLEVDEPSLEVAVDKILKKEGSMALSSEVDQAPDKALDRVLDKVPNPDSGRTFGRVKIGEKSYDYLVERTPAGYKIVLLDRTPLHDSLNDLLMVFLWVGGASLLILFGVSVYFASRAVRPIQEAFEKQRQFLADASHELRTPLTVIQTQLALLESTNDARMTGEGGATQWIHGIKQETTHMAALITDMLDLAKLEHVGVPVKIEVSLKALLEKALLTYEAIFFEHGVELSVALEEVGMVKGDPEGLRRALVILLDNAVKYTPEGGRVTVSLTREKHKACLRIRNTGEGIPADRLEAIFDRFVRLDASRTKGSGGYGLGLAIARAISEQHGGRLSADSTPGEWTEMTLVLPLMT
ncbi:sensor histidine kinase [Acidaminobacter hydrogenoformans]|uniref:histidine kinase n=1 Tax=Acidaminobacter hydrogenoformans DSM 2784 TaxID=1120920 RepID=A0A1G5RZQ8_9FIRM|nr:HAMP domain-containing sensor histidine kinase [Acidaminobacter hydrogenoformans]SCZ79348.1 Signal transduction histidine kinase [Acidaminobacter hydrogenoformans DSM 2784]